mmetsp:Transcript_13564/g.28439  ORF Transcript_13564/g.28439 Transcript_13564/m.28439 type:complete len:127 (+) Transcript_13564:184-564(+)
MSGNNDPMDAVQHFIDKNKDSFEQIGFGGVMGYCSGMAFRKAGKVVGVVIGVGFVGLQTAKNMGYIDVDWNKIRDDAIRPLDTNADGKIDAKDMEVWWKKSQAVMKDSVPEAGGFSAGFLLGARRG